MSGSVKKILIAVVAVLIIGFVLFMFYGGSIVKSAVETYGPEITGTSVTLEGVSFSPLSGKAGLSGLIVGSPQGFEAEKVFSLSEVSVAMETSTLFSDPVHITEIRIVNPEIVVEYQGGKLNVKVLMDNIEEYTGTEDESQTTVVIDDLYITHAKVFVMGLPVDQANQTIELSEIHLTSIGNETGSNEGTTFGEATRQTMAAVTAAVTVVVADSRIKNLLEGGKKFLKDKIKGLLGGGDDEEEDDEGGE